MRPKTLLLTQEVINQPLQFANVMSKSQELV